jgi:hypothetical protein
MLLEAVVEHLDIESGAIFTVGGIASVEGPGRQPGDRASDARGRLELAAFVGLADSAVAELVAAVRNPAHPIMRTLAEPAASFDVRPMNPGGPALRSHLPPPAEGQREWSASLRLRTNARSRHRHARSSWPWRTATGMSASRLADVLTPG